MHILTQCIRITRYSCWNASALITVSAYSTSVPSQHSQHTRDKQVQAVPPCCAAILTVLSLLRTAPNQAHSAGLAQGICPLQEVIQTAYNTGHMHAAKNITRTTCSAHHRHRHQPQQPALSHPCSTLVLLLLTRHVLCSAGSRVHCCCCCCCCRQADTKRQGRHTLQTSVFVSCLH
jgi:hypothetical protein